MRHGDERERMTKGSEKKQRVAGNEEPTGWQAEPLFEDSAVTRQIGAVEQATWLR